MAKKKSIGKFEIGTKVKVKPGVVSPEFPDFPLEGWTGTISEFTSKQPPIKCLIEWDEPTLKRMPADYLARCEKEGLYYLMICLGEDDLDGLD